MYQEIFKRNERIVDMKIAIIYKSLTGNTAQVAEAMKSVVPAEQLTYFGEPIEEVDADLYVVGSWVDKGNCVKEIGTFFKSLEGKKIAIFGTAGFGGSQEYYNTLFERAKTLVPPSNEVIGQFYCQGKMPMSVRDRYVSMMQANPEDKNLEVSLKNFDEALQHPNAADLEAAQNWLKTIANL